MKRVFVAALFLVAALADDDVQVTDGDGDGDEPTPEQKEQIEAQQKELEALQAKVEALRKQKREMDMKKKESELAMLQDLLGQMQGLAEEEESGKAPAGKSDPTVDAVEKMVNEMMAARAKEAEVNLEDNDVHACALMAGRRYGVAAGWSGESDPEKSAEETRTMIAAFANGDKSFDIGDASKHTAFKAIAACLKGLGQEGVEAFDKAGGFAFDSSEKLSDSLASEAEGRRSGLLTGDVLQLSFEKGKWKQLKAALQRLPWMNDAAGEKKASGKDEL